MDLSWAAKITSGAFYFYLNSFRTFNDQSESEMCIQENETYNCIKEYVFENIAWKMSDFMMWPQWIKNKHSCSRGAQRKYILRDT